MATETTDWSDLWENDNERFCAYQSATSTEREEMRRQYADYISRTYPVGAAAVELTQQEQITAAE